MDKNALKNEYKQTRRPMGMYCIRVLKYDRVFVGSATDLNARFNRHKTELKFGSHRNKELQALWTSLGESAFTFEILDVLDPDADTQSAVHDELNVLAEMWVQKLKQDGTTVVEL